MAVDQVTVARMLTAVGKATWQWDQELGAHIAICSRWKYVGGNIRRCGNGPLYANEIESGTCSEGPHLNEHECETPAYLIGRHRREQ